MSKKTHEVPPCFTDDRGYLWILVSKNRKQTGTFSPRRWEFSPWEREIAPRVFPQLPVPHITLSYVFCTYQWMLVFCRHHILPPIKDHLINMWRHWTFSSVLADPPPNSSVLEMKKGLWLMGLFFSCSSASGFLTNPWRACRWLSGEAKFRRKTTFSPLLSKERQTPSMEEPLQHFVRLAGAQQPQWKQSSYCLVTPSFSPSSRRQTKRRAFQADRQPKCCFFSSWKCLLLKQNP